jgi:branched chain amino acid efflux pump
MTAVWATVAVAGVASMFLKSFGPVAVGGRAMPDWFRRSIVLLAPGLLAALVATQTVAGERSLVLDERALGVGAAAIALLLRAPVLVVVIAAAAVTALARAA